MTKKRTDEHRDAPYGGSPYGGTPYGDPMYHGPAAYEDEDEEGIDLMRLIIVGLRRWKTILLAVLLITGCGFIYLKLAHPVYRGTVLMEMSVRRPRLVKESAVIEDQGRMDTDMIFNTRLAKFQSNDMRRRVAEQFLAAYPAITNSIDELMEQIEDRTSWEVRRKSYVVEVNVDAGTPEQARDLANFYASSAVDLMFDENQRSSDNAVAWLRQQSGQQEDQLATAEQALVNYRTEAAIDALHSNKQVAEASLLKLNESLIELERRQLTDEATVGYLKEVAKNPGAAETVLSGTEGSEQLQQFVVDWWNAKMNRNKLLERYTEAHALVKQANAEVEQTRKRLDGYLESLTLNLVNANQVLEKQVNVIKKRIDQEKQTIADLELKIIQKEGRLNTLMREKEAADSAYRSVLSRIEESRLAADENTAVLKVLQTAELPKHPVSPRKLRILALAILLGGMLGYGVAWILELLEDKVTGIKDIEKMGLSMLALIPQQKIGDRQQLAKLCMQDKFSHVTETFASLRVMLTYKEAKERYQVLLITSTQPAEGKTVTASNLAISMAQSGRKTLLIDCDLRRPRLKKIFAADKDVASLLHTLDKKNYDAFDQLPFNGGIENLDIIASQSSDTISPTELIGGEGIEKLIQWARENYECIIIDSPPLGVVGDSQGIADHVDGVILTAKPEYTRKRILRHTAERIEAVNTNVIGVVLDNVRIRRHHTYSNQYHHYNSYNAYGSYRADKEEKDNA
jgi:capsular exopolysaccharide synthesis family protein